MSAKSIYDYENNILNFVSREGIRYFIELRGNITIVDGDSGTGKTLLAISKTLNVSIEDLLSLEREEAKTVLPGFLIESINDYRKAIRKDSTLIDCYSDQLNSSINVAEVEGLISKEQADRLRMRYFWRKE